MNVVNINVAEIFNAQDGDVSSGLGQPPVSLENRVMQTYAQGSWGGANSGQPPALLGDRLLQGFAEQSISADNDKTAAMNMVEPTKFSDDPEKLFELQQKISDYSISINLISTLARKATDAVSTLLKS